MRTTSRISRRSVLAGAAALSLPAVGCHCGGGRAPAQTNNGPVVPPWRELSFDAMPAYPEPERALVLVPEGAASLPVVVALHGRGESGHGLDTGARGFRDFYGVDRIDARLKSPPVTRQDLLHFTTDQRLGEINASLAKAPYAGVVLACPYAPDLSDRTVAGAEPFGRFVTDTLLPKAREAAGAPSIVERTGIDGVSMGGRLALWIGLHFADRFGAVGAMQPALRVEEAPRVAKLAAEARAKNPKLRIRLLSSESDPFLEAVKAASAEMRAQGVDHDLVIVPGPHDYDFNRGPGCAEMLLWQERALRGLPSP
ncbi:MAG: alpha/beta hydrolase-fold protein [Polyangiaceae bacterium]